MKQKSRWIALILWFFLGFLGAHRFYARKYGTAVLWMLTLGLLGVGVFVDFFLILTGAFRTKEGEIMPWTRA